MERFSHVIGSTRFHGTYSILNLCIASHYDKRQVGIGLSDMLEQYQSPVVVSQEGVVLSGNGRTMAGELAAQDGISCKQIYTLLYYIDRYI